MCGIAGIITTDGSAPRELLREMRDCLVHRGPDDSGDWWSADGIVGLGHRRLSIIDLSIGGHQPMADDSDSIHIVFNGEIYNFLDLREELQRCGHHFRSSSDTEVMIHAYLQWGESFVDRFDGMFAFALYDERSGVVLLARDRAGEKPLFYFAGQGVLVFGSELKALFRHPAVPRRLDRRALDAYLAFAYVPGDLCMVEGVRKLTAGTMLRLEVRTLEQRLIRYWDVPPAWNALPQSDEELVEQLDRLLTESVRKQMIADVPVGILLSGGVDSSIVTAMAARVSPSPVKTFTITFPGYGAFDEGPYARIVAEHFGTEHQELVAEPATIDLLPLLARQYDEPMGDSSMIPTFLVSRLVRQHAKVALGGDGGDELFAGYPHYTFVMREHRLRGMIPAPLRALGGLAASRLMPVGMRGRNHLIGLSSDFSRTIAHLNTYFDDAARRRLLAGDLGGWHAESLREQYCRPDESPLRQAMVTDFKTYLADDILVKVDRASMLNSLEVRAPFLDRRIIEFAFTCVPDRLRVTRDGRKLLLRKLGRRLLPKQLDLSRKQGFSIPLDQWFAGAVGTFMKDVLSGADRDLFDLSVIRELLDEQARGRSNANRLFILTLFELWRREYAISI